jgi:MFS family permease
VAGIAAMVSGLLAGHLSDRRSPRSLGRLAAVGCGVGMVLTAACPRLGWLFPLRFVTLFFAGSIDPILNAWIAKTTPEAKRGAVFGLAVTAKASGWIVAPVLGALIAVHAGTRWVFVATGLFCWLMVPVIGWVSRRVDANGARAEGIPEASRSEAAVGT